MLVTILLSCKRQDWLNSYNMGVRHVFRHITFAPEQLHNLAWDVEQYPRFINFISALRIITCSEEQMRAEVRVKYKMIREAFITDVFRDMETLEIVVKLVKGPFRKLENHWRFHLLADGSTLVEFWVNFDFSIPIIGKLFLAKQVRAEKAILEAFERRADQLFTSIAPKLELKETVQQQIDQLQAVT